ncbi:hypothetical protein EPI10_011204 [Gossypium australe]|uniref:Uncharacterized protein n=1 Tax=Gossypium australe TaxID=47621 RepID=A0A5B6W770_9ROSI|nr:hypothetical protein EPI10_011204 [Gossypium australe]
MKSQYPKFFSDLNKKTIIEEKGKLRSSPYFAIGRNSRSRKTRFGPRLGNLRLDSYTRYDSLRIDKTLALIPLNVTPLPVFNVGTGYEASLARVTLGHARASDRIQFMVLSNLCHTAVPHALVLGRVGTHSQYTRPWGKPCAVHGLDTLPCI